jgi:hypothetical protein
VAVLVFRHQAFVPASVPRVWELVGHPERHPEWWPELVEVQGERFGRGCSYCQVTQDERGVNEMTLVVDRVTDLRELAVRCEENGLYMRWLLSDAQGGTLVDAEFGVDPTTATTPPGAFDPEAAKADLERWLRTSLDGLVVAGETARPGQD